MAESVEVPEVEFRGFLETEVGISQSWKRTRLTRQRLQEAWSQRVGISWIWKLLFPGRMVILGNEERLRDEDRGEEETRRGFGQRQEDEEYFSVCYKVRQGLVENSRLAWRYWFGRLEKRLWRRL